MQWLDVLETGPHAAWRHVVSPKQTWRLVARHKGQGGAAVTLWHQPQEGGRVSPAAMWGFASPADAWQAHREIRRLMAHWPEELSPAAALGRLPTSWPTPTEDPSRRNPARRLRPA